jgi:hypothetical protein
LSARKSAPSRAAGLAEGGEVGEVAAAEVAAPPQRVDLAADPEAAPDPEILGQEAAVGGRDHRQASGPPGGRRPLDLESVVALGQGCREEDRAAAVAPRVAVPSSVPASPSSASRHGRPRRGRQRQRRVLAGAGDQDRRQRLLPHRPARTSRSAPSPERTSTPMAASSTRLVSGVATCRTLSLSRNEASIP